MINIKRLEQENFMDCCQYSYRFELDDSIILFYQGGNRDLYFSCYSKEFKKEIDLKINLYEDYQLYKEIESLYNNLIQNPLYKKMNIKEVFNGKFINLESDDCINTPITDEDLIFNNLNIYKRENEFILKFINNSKRRSFSIVLNTDRSKYSSLVYYFMDLLNKLEEVTEEYHQISIDEWLTTKQLIKK